LHLLYASNADAGRLDYFGGAVQDLLRLIGSLQRRPTIDISEFSLKDVSNAQFNETLQVLSSLSIRSLTFRQLRSRIPFSAPNYQEFMNSEGVQAIMSACPNLESLSMMTQPQSVLTTTDCNSNRYMYNLNGDYADCLPPVKELSLNGYLASGSRTEEEWLSSMTAFQWSSIERLSICNDRLAEVLLPQFGDNMVNLQCLCVSAAWSPSRRKWTASDQAVSVVSRFLENKSFVELELNGFGKDLSMKRIASTRLRKLRLHMWEKDKVTAQANLMSAKDLQELAALAPNLEHLMFDIAYVGKLWHPTAISGVDVDVQLYQVFYALSKFSRLKKLHLFPRFSNPYENGEGFWRQAIEDDGQAVQIFKHLKVIRPSLELLILSSDNVVARIGEFEPMSWKVCQLGGNVLLRVRQGFKNYEQRQIWHGQRRLRTEIVRYSYFKPYLDGVGPRLSPSR
jgi:hypothetical protein